MYESSLNIKTLVFIWIILDNILETLEILNPIPDPYSPFKDNKPRKLPVSNFSPTHSHVFQPGLLSERDTIQDSQSEPSSFTYIGLKGTVTNSLFNSKGQKLDSGHVEMNYGYFRQIKPHKKL